MIFEPYNDEIETINSIHRYNSSEYTVIRLTPTMIKKNNIDANILLRDILKNKNLVNFNHLAHGGKNGMKLSAEFITNDVCQSLIMNFYRVNNSRGDRRFSIYGIKELYNRRLIQVGDLLYITVNTHNPTPTITLINITHNIPDSTVLSNIFGHDAIKESLSRLLPSIKAIAQQGYHPNSKGPGKISPKDAGDTLEHLLGIKTNNSPKADFEGIIELKSKTSKSLDTLFTLRPQFKNTKVELLEPNDRNRVSAFTRLYGYNSDKHIGYNSLYITIGSINAPQNSLGFYLFVNEELERIELRKKSMNNDVLTGYWLFENLNEELQRKHPATLWVEALTRINNNLGEFKYTTAQLSRSPQFATFLSLVKSGGITYDWRGYTTPSGKYSGKNHGNAWRIKRKQLELLFDNMNPIDLTSTQ
ncbi:MvaI/BcnI family restriction endonuclease [Latilactobacillus sp. 5-91]|uniref:MvaI/BcnI family restriction endonuclease n=1 Tax=Latilactobacillus sp. 5-91 TaxID=3410924 RepID=UPI003C706CFE